MAQNENRHNADNTQSYDKDVIETGYEIEADDEAFMQLDDVTLESILAEYKGSAFIDGDKKTPSSVLQEKTDRIIREVAGGQRAEDAPQSNLKEQVPVAVPVSTKTAESDDDYTRPDKAAFDGGREQTPSRPAREREKAAPESKKGVPAETARLPDISAVNLAKSREYRVEKAKTEDDADPVRTADSEDAPEEKTDSADIVDFNVITGQQAVTEDDIIRAVSEAIEQQTQLEQETQQTARRAFGLFRRRNEPAEDVFDSGFEQVDDETSEPDQTVFEDVYVEEPDLGVVTRQFAEKCNMYSTRFFASLALSVVLVVLTIIFEAGGDLPFGIGQNTAAATGILLILMFIVMMFSAEKLADGIFDILKGRQGIETLNLFSCLATASAAIFSMINDTAAGMPFCAVSAFSLTFTLWGERVYYRSMTDSLRTIQTTTMPTGVVVAMCDDIERSVIKKVSGKTDGFYNNLIQEDIGETAFRYATPILIISAVVLAFLSSFGQEQRLYFTHNFAAIMAAAAPFSALLAYAVPFNATAKRARHTGAAVAGWGGADELFHSDGASIKDEDLFPAGTVSLGGVKIFEEVSPDKAIRYTSSLIIASGSVLSTLFMQLLNKQGLIKLNVENFQCYEGGIGGMVRGERVVTGSAALMSLLGIRVPPSLNMKNGIFTAIDKKLIAVFTIDYVPVKTVQSALVSILRNHVKLMFSVRDFNITPVMLEQKFKVPVDDVEYIPIADTYDLSDDAALETKRTAAVLLREGIGPYVEAIIGGRRLRVTALVATILSLLTAVGGMVIMYSICMTGAFSAGSPSNLLLYMASMTAVVLIVCGFARYRQ